MGAGGRKGLARCECILVLCDAHAALTLLPQTWKVNVPAGWVLDEKGNDVKELTIAPSDILSVLLSVGLVSAEVASNHTNHTLNNLVACLIATDILQLVGLRSFRAAGLMLVGLLAYDVFW